MTWIPVAALLRSDAPDTRPVAFDADGTLRRLGDLRHDAGAIAAALRGGGATGAVLLADDTYWFLVGLLGAMHAGVPLTLPSPPQLGALLSGQGADTVLLSDTPRPVALPELRLDLASEAPAATAALAPIDPAQTAIAFCTSGSTGLPKQVHKRLAHLEREIATLEATFGAEAGRGRVHATVANHHIYGILFSVLWPLARGVPLARRPAEHWAPLLSAMAQDAILVSSPAHLTRLDPAPPRGQARMVFSSGGPLPLEAAAATQAQLGILPVEVFGSTETGGVAWRRQSGPDIPWRPFAGVVLEPSPEGTLRVRSALFDEPHIDMGDKVAFAGDGTFSLAGRADRIVKVEGVRVSLAEIETALLAVPGIAAAAALLLPGPRAAIAAIVVPTQAARARLAKGSRLGLLRLIRRSLLPGLPRVALPRRLRVVDAIPVNSQGKRIPAELEALFHDAPPGPADDPDVLAIRHLPDACEIDLLVPEGLPCFRGHFTGFPVLPGVVQVDWAVRLGARHLGIAGDFAGLRNLKFKRVITPGSRLQLKLARRPGAGRLAFEYRSAEQSLSAGEVELAPA